MEPVDEQSFINAIIATPEDDMPRLIFADWLEEHGNQQRAEFIRAQIQIANRCTLDGRPLDDDERRSLDRFCSDHLTKCEDQYEKPFRQCGLRVEQYRKGLPAVLRVEKHKVHNLPDRLNAACRLGPINGITFANCELTEEALRSTLESQCCGQITSLDFTSCKLANCDMRVIGPALNASHLKCLNLSNNIFTRDGIESLGRNQALCSRLETLDVSNNEIDSSAVHVIATRFPQLKRLNLANTRCGKHGVRALATAQQLTNLFSVDLSNTEATAEALGWLGMSSNLPELTSLTLSNNQLGNAGVAVIVDSCLARQLTTLKLSDIGCGDLAAQKIADSESCSKLKLLDLTHNRMGKQGLCALANSNTLADDLYLRLDSFSGSLAALRDQGKYRIGSVPSEAMRGR